MHHVFSNFRAGDYQHGAVASGERAVSYTHLATADEHIAAGHVPDIVFFDLPGTVKMCIRDRYSFMCYYRAGLWAETQGKEIHLVLLYRIGYWVT